MRRFLVLRFAPVTKFQKAISPCFLPVQTSTNAQRRRTIVTNALNAAIRREDSNASARRDSAGTASLATVCFVNPPYSDLLHDIVAFVKI
jgi:hypothetical protein